MTSGERPKRRVQSASLMTTTSAMPGWSSSASEKTRPSAGRAPRRLKYDGLTRSTSTRSGSSSGGTPVSSAYTAFNKAQGSITRGGAALAQVTGARLAYSNSVEAVRTIRADRKIEGADPGIARATGQITARFADTTLLTQAQNGTAAEFAFAFTIDANRSLTFTLHEVYLALAKTPIEGPAGVEASFEFRAAFNATATRMMTAVLKNQQAGTEYA